MNNNEYIEDIIKNLIADPTKLYMISKIDFSLFGESLSKTIEYISKCHLKKKPVDFFKVNKLSGLNLAVDSLEIKNSIESNISKLLGFEKILAWNATKIKIDGFMHKCNYEDVHTKLHEFYRRLSDGAFSADDNIHGEYMLSDVIENIMTRKREYFPLNWGIQRMTDDLNHMERHSLVIIGGRPSMGKTSFVINMIANNLSNKKILMFSLEQGAEEIAQRFLAASLNISLNNIQDDNLTSTDRKKALSVAKRIKKNVVIMDNTTRINDIIHKTREFAFLHGNNGFIVVDFLQLIAHNKSESKNTETENTTVALKHLAKEVGMPIILLSQLSRAIEQREDKRPLLSDLRDSGAIEQNADIVVFPYRPSVYNQMDDSKKAYIYILKNKNGPKNTVTTTVDLSTQKWG